MDSCCTLLDGMGLLKGALTSATNYELSRTPIKSNTSIKIDAGREGGVGCKGDEGHAGVWGEGREPVRVFAGRGTGT